jgi:hypothetical protein
MSIPPDEIESWARRALEDRGARGHGEDLAELVRDPDRGLAILSALGNHPDRDVRGWAGALASLAFGPAAVPLLKRLVNDPDADNRDAARQDLESIDPAFLLVMLPDLRSVLLHRRDKWGEDRAAMWRVARVRDTASVEILRRYAQHYPSTDYHHRMPLVLADYIEDPERIADRIRAHDHDWMFWLVEAAARLPVPDADGAFSAALAASLDDECEQAIRSRPRQDAAERMT